jgi:hypothetical protein
MEVNDMLDWFSLTLDKSDKLRVEQLNQSRNKDNKIEVDAELFGIYFKTSTNIERKICQN